MRLPRDIIERVVRVTEYHAASKLTVESVRAHPTVLDPATKPSPYRRFDDLPRVALPTVLLDAPVPAGELLGEGLTAVPDSQLNPPQDLKTLASWLYLANGLGAQREGAAGATQQWLRTCPSSGALYPFEVYVAAFGVEGLEPGLYHYSVKEFALRKMRDGAVTLATIKRGRPDLNFLKTVPAALLVSTIFWRSAWRYRQRGYRMALLDAGHLVENLVAAGNGLGVQTMTRLQMNDSTTRELIGIADDGDFGACEAVQAMVVWADVAARPLVEPPPTSGRRGALPRIARAPLSARHVTYGSIPATHLDCVSPGMPVRDIRPPLTELSPVPAGDLRPAPAYTNEPTGKSVRQVLLGRRSTRAFTSSPISRDAFLAINRLSFRGGTAQPMQPDGPHVALLRPIWMVHEVTDMEPGIWYYDPAHDGESLLKRGRFRRQSEHLCMEQPLCAQAAAVCFLMADLRALTAGAGPDAYRLAHLEAGIGGERVYLAAGAMGLACCGIGAFYDDEVVRAAGFEGTGWEPLYGLAIGVAKST